MKEKIVKLFIGILLLVVLSLPLTVSAGSVGGSAGGGATAGGSGGGCTDSRNCVRGWGTRVTLVYYDFDGRYLAKDAYVPIKAYMVARPAYDVEGPGHGADGDFDNGEALLPGWNSRTLMNAPNLQSWEGQGVSRWYAGNLKSDVDTAAVNPYDSEGGYFQWVESLRNGVFSSNQPQGLKQPASQGGGTPADARPTERDLAWKYGLKLWRQHCTPAQLKDSMWSCGGSFTKAMIYTHINVEQLGKYYVAVEPIYETFLNPNQPKYKETWSDQVKYAYTEKTGEKTIYYCNDSRVTWTYYSTKCTGRKKTDKEDVYETTNTNCKERKKAKTTQGQVAADFNMNAKCWRNPNAAEIKQSAKIHTARSGGQKNYLRSISNPEGNWENRFCDAGNCGWHVGPSRSTALVKSGGVYNLISASARNSATSSTPYAKWKGDSRNVAVGIAFYYLNTNCRDACYGKTGDDKLICAESFCDSYGYNRNKPEEKKICVQECLPESGKRCTDSYEPDQVNEIKEYCKLYWKEDEAGYASESECVEQCTCSGEDCPSNSCADYDPNAGDATKPNVGQNTSCGNVEGGYKTCDSSNYSHPAIDQRKYYTVSCVEKSKFDFRDVSKTLLIPGQGLYYDVKLDGNKICRVYFDVNAWNIDYAGIHSKDPDAKAKLAAMEKHYQDFNRAFAPTVSNPDQGDIPTFNEVLKGEFKQYKLENVSVDAQFNEVINRKNELSKRYILISEDQTAHQDSIANLKTDTLLLVHAGSVKRVKVNNYQTSSVRAGHYQMPGQCLTHDGNAEVYEPTGETCNDGTIPQKLYYTSLLAMTRDVLPAGMKHEVIANAKAFYDGGQQEYTSSRDVCTFNFECKDGDENCPPPCDPSDPDCPEAGKCVITVKSGERVPGIDNAYFGDVELELGIVGLPDTKINAAGMDINQLFDPTAIEWLKTINDTADRCSNKPLMVYGKVKLSDGGELECELPLNFIGNCPEGDLACKITKEKRNLYRIEATGRYASSALYYYSIRGGTQVRLQPDANNNKYYINTNEEAATIVGIVKANGLTAYCPAASRCTDYYQPTETSAINKYCDKNWSTDLAGYVSAEDCKNRCVSDDEYGCTNPDGCPSGSLSRRCVDRFKKDEVKEIKEYCLARWDKDLGGYKSAEDCITGCTSTKALCSTINNPSYTTIYAACYNNPLLLANFARPQNCANICCEDTGVCSGSRDYVYRPVSMSNPFPDSYLDANSVNNTRPIGGNWYGKQNNITKTAELVSVKGNEYVIKLDAETIRAIKLDNANYNKNNEGNVYVDYIYSTEAADRIRSGKTSNAIYESKFIHDIGDGGFRNIFTIIDREVVNQ